MYNDLKNLIITIVLFCKNQAIILHNNTWYLMTHGFMVYVTNKNLIIFVKYLTHFYSINY